MASIRKRGNTYKIEVFKARDLSGHKIIESCTFTPDPAWSERKTERELRKFADAFEEKVKNGTSRGDALTFEKYALQWLDNYISQEMKPTTIDAYRRALKCWLFPRCGYMKLSEFTPMVIQGIINDMRKTGYSYTTKNGNTRSGAYSEETLHDAHKVISAVLGSAYLDGLIPSNPATRGRAKKKRTVTEGKVSAWDESQAMLFLERMQGALPVVVGEKTHHRNGKEVKVKGYTMKTVTLALKYQVLFYLALYSGCRRGEILGLTWECVSFSEGTITIRLNAQYVSGYGSYNDTPKTQSGYRTIILPSACMKLLKRLKIEQAKEIMMMGTAWHGDRTQNTGFVFCQENGERMGVATPNKKFRETIKMINHTLDDDNQLPIIRFHDLRHTSASLLIALGVDPVSVAHRLGHSDATTTLRIYSHAFKEADRAAADALEAVLSDKKVAAI